MGKVPDWLANARGKWQFQGKSRPDFAEVPKDGQTSVWDFPRPPAIVPVRQLVSVFHDDSCIAETTNALAICETASPPTYYIPYHDIQRQLLIPIPKKKSLCEWKGSADYWALKSAPQQAIGWSYENPFHPFESLVHHIAFYPQQLNCFVGKSSRPLEKKTLQEPYLTVEQVRLAASAWITAQQVKPSLQYRFFQKVVDVITYRQNRNRDSRVSHWKTTIKKMEALVGRLSFLTC